MPTPARLEPQFVALIQEAQVAFAVIAAIDFLLVQIHYVVVYKHEQKRSHKIMAAIAMFFEVFVLGPLIYLGTNMRPDTALTMFLVGLSVVSLISRIFSYMKVFQVQREMAATGRIADNNKKLLIAGLVLLYVGAIVPVFPALVMFVGAVLFLHGINKLRKAGAPSQVSRIFWSNIAGILIGFLGIIVLIAVATQSAIAIQKDVQAQGGNDSGNGNGGMTNPNETMAPPQYTPHPETVASAVAHIGTATALLLMVARFIDLCATGYWVGDMCCAPNDITAGLQYNNMPERSPQAVEFYEDESSP